MKPRTKYLIIFFVLAIPVTFLSLTFYNSKGCDQLVIDSYEVHAGIDIPQTDYSNCQYNSESNIRMTVFHLTHSMSTSGFEEMTLDEAMKLIKTPEPDASVNLSGNPPVWVREGRAFTDDYVLIYEPQTDILIAEMRY